VAALLRLHDALTQAAFGLACAALLVLLGAYLFEVTARYAFNAPTRWSSDLVQYALCATVALALPAVTRDSGHVAITALLDKLSPPRQALAARAIQALGFLVTAATAAGFAQIAATQAAQGIETVAAFAIPKWWLSAMVTFGFAGASLHLLRQALAGTSIRGNP